MTFLNYALVAIGLSGALILMGTIEQHFLQEKIFISTPPGIN
jgi:hypothetical protein